MLVLGVDPGTATTGYGLVEETPDGRLVARAYGVITTPAELSQGERLLQLFTQLENLIQLHRPDEGAVEKLFFEKNVTTGMAVSQARGVILLAMAKMGISGYEYAPVEIKRSVAGYGGAKKAQMQEMVRLLLQLPAVPRPDDAADALAIAICHHQNRNLRVILEAGSA